MSPPAAAAEGMALRLPGWLPMLPRSLFPRLNPHPSRSRHKLHNRGPRPTFAPDQRQYPHPPGRPEPSSSVEPSIHHARIPAGSTAPRRMASSCF